MNPLRTNQSIKAVFFDVDGVLLDSLPQHLQFCRDKARELGLDIQIPDVEQFRRKVASGAKANPMKEFLRTVGFPEAHIDAVDADYQAHFGARYKPAKFAGVDQMLDKLRAMVPLGLVTSNVRQNVESALGNAMAYFREDLVFFKDHRDGHKKAKALTEGARALQIEPEDCVFVGDVPTDASAALQAGQRFLGVTYGWGILGGEGFKTVDSVAGISEGLLGADRIPFPFDSSRKTLYKVHELWTGYDPDMSKNSSLDAKIFRYFKNMSKYSPRLEELRAQRSHDAGIEDAIDELLAIDDRSFPTGKRRPVMILGSHSKYRRDLWFTRVAHLAYDLVQAGFFIATGGGPGLMEAGNLGAYMANYTKAELDDALDILRTSQQPPPGDKRKQYEMPDYWEVAMKVATKYPDGGESLGVPTWFYGHEGANRFVSHIAKFLSNGLRESKMTSIGVFGSIFAPGGPGTAQEVFTDAAENSYHSFQWLSPMVFFNEPDDENTTKMLDILRKQTSPDYLSQEMYLRTTDTQLIGHFLKCKPPQFRERKD